jgi:hypothetical protein
MILREKRESVGQPESRRVPAEYRCPFTGLDHIEESEPDINRKAGAERDFESNDPIHAVQVQGVVKCDRVLSELSKNFSFLAIDEYHRRTLGGDGDIEVCVGFLERQVHTRISVTFGD